MAVLAVDYDKVVYGGREAGGVDGGTGSGVWLL